MKKSQKKKFNLEHLFSTYTQRSNKQIMKPERKIKR